MLMAEDTRLSPIVALSGADTKIAKTDYLKIDSQNKWEDVWLQHVGCKNVEKYDYFFNKNGIPVVDFEKYMVIAVFQAPGENCAGIDAYSIIEKEKEIIFDFEAKYYQVVEDTHDPGNAFGFFVLPKSDKKIVIRSVFRTFLARIGKEPIKYQIVATIE